MNSIKRIVNTLVLTTSLLTFGAFAQKAELQVFGQVEQTTLEGSAQTFPSRIDTGATTSSINAQDIQFFSRNDKDYVTFNFPTESGDVIKMEKEIVRWASIRQAHSPEGKERPVVELEVSINGEPIVAEFSLKDRSHMTYPVLIGRNILAGRAVVDVSVNAPRTNS